MHQFTFGHLVLPALLVGLQLVTPRLGRPPGGGGGGEPRTEERKRSVRPHGSHSPVDTRTSLPCQSESAPFPGLEPSAFLRHSFVRPRGTKRQRLRLRWVVLRPGRKTS